MHHQAPCRSRRQIGQRLACALWIVLASHLSAQDDQSNDARPDGQSGLVEGLLDLLAEPQPSPPSPVTPRAPYARTGEQRLDGEDLGTVADDPLEAIGQDMLMAAAYLDRGVTDKETQSLQQDIVTRLDEMIEKLEQSSRDAQQRQQSQQMQSSLSENRAQQQPRQAPVPAGVGSQTEVDEAQNDGSTNPGDDTPGTHGAAARVTMDSVDPRALQQSVWGQLPERTRQQMNSRMVERFLPSYREQIEAYFQALLHEQ